MVKPATLTLALAKPRQPATFRADSMPSGYIELLFCNTRVLVHGAPDRQTLHNVIVDLRTLSAYPQARKSGLQHASPRCAAALIGWLATIVLSMLDEYPFS